MAADLEQGGDPRDAGARLHLHGAYQLWLEEETGSIEAGKRADFIMLDEDLFAIDRERIHTVVPSAVVMDGVIVRGALH